MYGCGFDADPGRWLFVRRWRNLKCAPSVGWEVKPWRCACASNSPFYPGKCVGVKIIVMGNWSPLDIKWRLSCFQFPYFIASIMFTYHIFKQSSEFSPVMLCFRRLKFTLGSRPAHGGGGVTDDQSPGPRGASDAARQPSRVPSFTRTQKLCTGLLGKYITRYPLLESWTYYKMFSIFCYNFVKC